ncbi:MAG: crotonase/enoyl-CoA hydratase family protein [Alphaproteobacteria bacterium]|jgi:enoyl-CoA hydratase/carnithine racemase|nr:crotonase/enoyl-CoA hydratase family protein [Alphaproteobacteria bacterium]
MSKFLRYKKTGHIVTLTMNAPESMNALSGLDQYGDFEKYCAKINQDYDVRCVILTGNGRAFSAGGNVKDMQDRNNKGQPPSVVIRDWYKNGIQRIPMAFYNLEVPTIAAVNGAATGAGCDLTCMADIRIASTYARFAETFVKIGISPGDGGAYFLPRVISMSNAAEMVFTGELIDAAKALETGLVSQVVEPDELMNAAKAMADRIAANPPHALRLSKKLLRESSNSTMNQLLELSAVYNAMLQHTDDHRERVDDLVARISSKEKKKPAAKRAPAKKKAPAKRAAAKK